MLTFGPGRPAAMDQPPQPPTAPGGRRASPPGPSAGARRAHAEAAHRLYDEVVKQARTPLLYSELGVPDTPEGRFEMVALHAALLIRRLRAAGGPGRALGQALFDLMFADMDASMRELGVGDLGVGKQVQRLAGQFYARLAALDDAFGKGDMTLSLRSCAPTSTTAGRHRAGSRSSRSASVWRRWSGISPCSRRSRCCTATPAWRWPAAATGRRSGKVIDLERAWA